jgi:hypothetical protein
MDDSGIYTVERSAGTDRLIVAFINQDTSSQVDLDGLVSCAADDAARRETDGWRLISLGALPLRQMGTAGNIMFQSGGGFETQVALMALYGRAPGPG